MFQNTPAQLTLDDTCLLPKCPEFMQVVPARHHNASFRTEDALTTTALGTVKTTLCDINGPEEFLCFWSTLA